MTTSSPTLAEKISVEFLKVGAYAFDLPVTGGDIGARNATLSIMAGGDKKVFESAFIQLFVLENYDKDLFEPVYLSNSARIYKLLR